MSKLYDVVIAGGGPVGLFLACELALARVSVVVLERDATSESPLKTAPLGLRGINTLTLESLARRGLLDKVIDQDGPESTAKAAASARPFEKTGKTQFGGHFAGLFFDANKLELGRWPYRINGPGMVPGPTTMARVEAVFAERAASLGVSVLRGHAVKEVDVADDRVAVATEGAGVIQGRWLVGCDGGRSAVRKVAGFTVEMSEPQFTGYAFEGDVEGAAPLKPGFVPTPQGLYIIPPRLSQTGNGLAGYLLDADGGAFDRRTPLTADYLQTVLRRVTGLPDIAIRTLQRATSFTDRSLQATTYRRGRVLLAGDAAHTHATFGAQGMNLGIGDAMNLGWKLAAAVRADMMSDATAAAAAHTLLDTYDAERQPVAAQVVEMARAQSTALLPNVGSVAIRSIIRRLSDTVDGANLLMGLFWGLSQRYDLTDGAESPMHPAVGVSMPDFALADGSRLNYRLASARGLLVDFVPGPASVRLQALADAAPNGRVDYVAAAVADGDTRGLQAMLVRPDGVVAWAVDDAAALDPASLQAAISRWFSV